ncbi:translation initiation factor IF-2-like [Paramacrobiotus metropolitanus]|uniref:translation initiation factor IF-2-like n=1 Tax=Paramacrobiotus metropolitanus TaxID=2943436 RepID=UPI002445C9F2|nr:translation initiation factor IF-2-like [Paramacrobiotus metropolitanus]
MVNIRRKIQPRMRRLPVPASIPSRHRVLVADNSDKFGFGTGALRFPHETVPENPGPAKYPAVPPSFKDPAKSPEAPPGQPPPRKVLLPGRSTWPVFGSTVGRFPTALHTTSPPVGTYTLTDRKPPSRPTHRTPVVVHHHAPSRRPSPTRYNVQPRFGGNIARGRAVFRSRLPRIHAPAVTGLFPWAYDVQDHLLHPTAPRACSIRYTAPRMPAARRPTEGDLWSGVDPLRPSRSQVGLGNNTGTPARRGRCSPSGRGMWRAWRGRSARPPDRGSTMWGSTGVSGRKRRRWRRGR